MLTSWQIAQMHGQQAQAFGQQQALGQQISSRMPMPYQGLGATGFQSGFGQGGGYNYGSPFNGYGPGNSFGNTMTSMIGGIGNAVGGGMGIAGGIGGFMMGGARGAMMGFAGGGIIGAGIQHVAGSFMEGAHEQSALERTLSQFQFQNAGSRTGRGFNRQDSMQIGNMVRQMERIPEMLTSFGELNKLMDKMGQMGLMQGVRDAGEFMRKFRDTTNTLRDMAKMMGTTMEGALQAFGEARQAGFYNKGDISRNVVQRQMVGALTGMNQGQVGGLQAYGAELAHSLGGSRAGGARNMLRTAGQLGAANQMGILSNDMIMEMTGKEGAEGIQDLSGMMGQLSYRMGRSNVGQALTLALGKMENGRYTGEMDQELVERVRRGDLSLGELKSMARRKASTRGAKLSFAAHKNRLRTEMSGAVGSEGIAMQLQEILGDRGWDNPDAHNLVMQRFGASEEQANLLQKLMPNLQNIGNEMGLAGKSAMRTNALNSRMAEGGWDAIKHRISKKLQHYTTDWAKDLGAGVRDYFQNWADEFMDDLSGRYTKEVTQRVSNMARFGGLGAISGQIQQTIAGAGGTRMDVGRSGGFSGLAARAAHWAGGKETAGERMDYILAKHMGGRYLHHGRGLSLGKNGQIMDAAQAAAAGGNIVLDSTFSGRASFTSEDEMKKLIADMSSGSYGSDQLKTLQGVLSKDELGGLKSSFKSIMESGEISQIADPVERERAIYSRLRKSNSAGMSDIEKTLERSGAIAKSALGKARQKGGLGEGDIVAALQQAVGGNYRAGMDWQGMVGGIDSMSGAAIAQAMSKASDKMKKITGSDTMTSGAELKAYLDEGGDMGRVAMQLANASQITDPNALMQGSEIKTILAGDPSKWGDKEKAALKKAGIDPGKMAAKLSTPEGQKEMDRLLSLASSGKISGQEIENYLRLGDAAGAKEIISRYTQKGAEIKGKLKGDYAKSVLGSTKEGQKVLALLNKKADQLSAVSSGQSIDNLSNDGELEKAMAGLTAEQRSAAFDIDDTLSSTTSYRKGLTGRGGLRRGSGVQGILEKAGLGNLGFTGAEGDFRAKLEGLLGGNKKLDKGEMDQVVNLLTTTKQKGLFSKAGSEAASTQVSEADIAKSLETMSSNAKQTAQLLADLAAGKKPGESKTN